MDAAIQPAKKNWLLPIIRASLKNALFCGLSSASFPTCFLPILRVPWLMCSLCNRIARDAARHFWLSISISTMSSPRRARTAKNVAQYAPACSDGHEDPLSNAGFCGLFCYILACRPQDSCYEADRGRPAAEVSVTDARATFRGGEIDMIVFHKI